MSRRDRGAHARLEIIGAGSDAGFQVEAKIDPSTVFRPISKRGTHRVDHLRPNDNGPSVAWRARRRRDPDVTSHRPTGALLEIESADGAKNILYPATPEAYSLPPGR
jgi:hypothetical protein